MSSDSLYRGEQSTVIEAILAINPKAQVVCIDDKVVEWHNDTPPISKADIESQIPIVEKEITDAASKKATDKASADAKLKALGLTDDEIEAFRS